MEQQLTTQSAKHSFLLIGLVILITALIIGGGIYFWQKFSFSKILQEQVQQAQQENEELQQKINELENQIAQLQARKETPESEEPTEKPDGTEKALGYVKTVYEKDVKRYLDIDYVQWLTHSDGTCSLSGKELPGIPQCNPNGYLIVNQNPKIRTFEISENVEIVMCSYGSGECYIEWNEYIDYETFKSLFVEAASPCSYFVKYPPPFHITIQDNRITEIVEQYIP